jgi:hypothetical protein
VASKPNRPIARRLQSASIAINNTLADQEIQALVGVYGYTPARMQEGKALYDSAVEAVSAQAAAAGAQRRATLQATDAERQARNSYKGLAKVARAVFKSTSAERKALALRGATPQGTAAFLTAAEKLCENALNVAEVKTTLAEYGYDEARLQEERAVISGFAQAHQAQVAAMGAAIEATHAQNLALQQLSDWMVRYRAIATAALQHNPQLAERLGFAVRTTPIATQRAAKVSEEVIL